MIEAKVICKLLNDFEEKNTITEIIILGKNGGISRIQLSDDEKP
jgi:TnpA family transposase